MNVVLSLMWWDQWTAQNIPFRTCYIVCCLLRQCPESNPM